MSLCSDSKSSLGRRRNASRLRRNRLSDYSRRKT
jgi:hypothetical protein